MKPTFLGLSVDVIRARIQDAASAAAGTPVVVRVGEEMHGYRNIGVDLPQPRKGRRTAAEASRLRNRLRAALEATGVPLAEIAIAPKVGGDIVGSVRVREPTDAERATFLGPSTIG